MPTTDVRRYAAFAERPDQGNPAGVVLHARRLSSQQMQHIAKDVGYSETAFVTSALGSDRQLTVRYFAPGGEVDFCGHATIATTVALGHEIGFGGFSLSTNVGTVRSSAKQVGDSVIGVFESPMITSALLSSPDLENLLRLLGWESTDLHPDYPAAIGFAGNWHPVLVARHMSRLAELDYDFAMARDLCLANNWVTLQLVSPVGDAHWRSRNPFPWGGVVEDPATGRSIRWVPQGPGQDCDG